MPRCLLMLTSFFDKFLIDFCPLMFSWFFRFSGGFDFSSLLGANLPPFSLPKSTKIASKIDLERHRFFDRFWHRFFIDFGSIWEPILRPCWPLFRAQNGPPSRYSPLCLHVGSMLSLLAPFWTFLAPSWPHFDSILEDLKSILQVFGCHLAFDFYLSAKGSAEWAKPF